MNYSIQNLKIVRIGLLISLCTILFGFGLGGLFGGMENAIKTHLSSSGNAVLATVYKNDKKVLEKILKKSWIYLKRAHMHAGAIGSTSLILILLLSILPVKDLWKRLNSFSLGAGAMGYSVFWLLAGLNAPTQGSTSLTKESLSWLAIPSAFLILLGTAGVLVFCIYCLFIQKKP